MPVRVPAVILTVLMAAAFTSVSWAAAPSTPMPTARAYSDTSPFNTPVGDRPTVSAQSDQIVANSYLTGGLPSAISTAREPSREYDHPVYHAQPSDPLVTIRAMGGSVNNMQINLPDHARPAGGSDGHLGVVTPDGWEYDLWQVTRTGSTLNVRIGYRQRADGPGIVTPAMALADRTLGGGTAPNFGLRAGIISAAEMQSGRIPHALFIVIQAGSADTSFGFGTVGPGANGRGGAGSSVYPAFKGDATAPGVRAPMGARFWLDMTEAEIDASGAPLWERTIAKAMHEYGGYFGDTGGAGLSFMLESSSPYVAAGVANPWDGYWPAQGVRKDPTWGYNATFSGRIPWSARLRVIAPPAVA